MPVNRLARSALRALQANINHCRAAQDLLHQHLHELDVDFAMVTEPFGSPNHPRWIQDLDNTTAITWAVTDRTSHEPIVTCWRGHGRVAVKLNNMLLTSCYVSPNSGRARFEHTLADLSRKLRGASLKQQIITGDFNAKSTAWGNRASDLRGRILLRWIQQHDLIILNEGYEPTFVSHNGSSVEDLTLASRGAAQRIGTWRVLTDTETLSDYRYVYFESPIISPNSSRQQLGRRWKVKKLDLTLLRAAAVTSSWQTTGDSFLTDATANVKAKRLRSQYVAICDAAMPRSRPRKRPGSAYWWSDNLALMRKDCIAARRRLHADKRRGRDVTASLEAYRESRNGFRAAIRRAKEQAWEELIDSLNKEPFGRPYRLVLRKLQP